MTKRTNTSKVDDIIDNIKAALRSQTASWQSIADQFAIARDQYGSDSDAFKKIMKATNFAKSTAAKLAKVGADSRLTDPAFQHVHAWTVLYEITTLNDQQILDLKNMLNGKAPTVRMVAQIRDGAPTHDDYSAVFHISVDVAAIRSGRFDDKAYAELTNAVTALQRLAYVRVDETTLFKMKNDAYRKRLNAEIDNLKQAYVSESIRKSGKDDKKKPELVETFKCDPGEFARECGVAPINLDDIVKCAKNTVDRRMQNRLGRRTKPFAPANTAVSKIISAKPALVFAVKKAA